MKSILVNKEIPGSVTSRILQIAKKNILKVKVCSSCFLSKIIGIQQEIHMLLLAYEFLHILDISSGV